MLLYLWVGLGSAIGGILRFWLSGLLAATKLGATFPLGTLFVNVTGSFIIGFFNASTSTDGRFFAPAAMRTFFMIGICGGYTTFSSFSLQTLELARDEAWGAAFANIALSLLLCLAAVAAGHLLAVRLGDLAQGEP